MGNTGHAAIPGRGMKPLDDGPLDNALQHGHGPRPRPAAALPVTGRAAAAAARALLIVAVLFGFFLVGTPLQWLVARVAPGQAHRLPRCFCRSLLRLTRVRVAVRGTPARDGPVLLVANHVSWIDILALGAALPLCCLAKREVASWPLVSAFAVVQGTVFVDRRRRRSILAANRDIAARLRDGRHVLLFPEGTTLADALPGRFLSSHFAAARDYLAGAGRQGMSGQGQAQGQARGQAREQARAEVGVQPVAVAYSSPAAAWIGDDTLLAHVWRTLLAPPLLCSLGFGAPIPYRVGSNRKEVAAQARAAVTAMVVSGRNP